MKYQVQIKVECFRVACRVKVKKRNAEWLRK